MVRPDCICNRNIKIISMYVESRLGHCDLLFDNLPYPSDRYPSPEDFFLNEDEWTTYDNFEAVFRRAKDMVGEIYFYFNCGASSANLRSWGRFHHFARIFSSPNDGFKRVPFFNRNLDDTKDIDIVLPPTYDNVSGKIRTVLRVKFRDGFDAHRDYIGDPFLRGILSSIPTVWGLKPALVKQPLNSYDPERLFKSEPEFSQMGFDLQMDDGLLTLVHPLEDQRRVVGKTVLLEPERLDGHEVFLGKYSELPKVDATYLENRQKAVVITDTVKLDSRIVLKAGEIFMAPYFILDVSYDRLSFLGRISQLFKFRRGNKESEKGFIETINRLRETMDAKNATFRKLEVTNAALKEAKQRVDDYARNLEHKVAEKTQEYHQLNQGLEARVAEQVSEIEKYNALRRYLSPNLAQKILSSGDDLGTHPQRKLMTVVFTDIRGFSAISDSLESEELFHLLDRYLSEMTVIVHRFEGTLNKMIGDGLLIFFGDPIPMEDHAERAVKMAIDMQKRVAALKDEWLQFGHVLGIGIGINTGYMTVGNIGSEMHRDYTVIGNQVNVAARLESEAEKGQILISQRTYSRVKDLVDTEEMGEIKVKGIHSPIMIYNVKVD